MTQRSLPLPDPGIAPESYHLPADKLLAGNPLQQVWNHYTSADGKFSAGLWQSEPGKWNIRYTEEEFCTVLAGVSVVTDAAGNRQRLEAGSSLIIPRGFSGTWEVLETTRKIYVIYEPGG